ncbi:MAG: FAD-dependent oxidoreductase [Planctomycetaceae bacterium]
MLALDAVIFGGGAAGLWLLDRLSRDGARVVLLEASALGAGQTISAQGIIHGGLKYTLQGLLTKSARHIRGMPGVWRDALLGRVSPNLTRTSLRADCCHLWQTESLSSTAGMIGAKIGLQVKPEYLEHAERPAALAHVPGNVAKLAEQVISPASFLADLFEQYQDRILKIDAEQGLEFKIRSPGEVAAIHLTLNGQRLSLSPRQVIFTAGAGNSRLRQQVGLSADVLQLRPLHMVLVRGALPELNGHCVDGSATRVTITSDRDELGRTVWQIGGQIAEEGVGRDPLTLTQLAKQELTAVLPGVNFADAEWSTYAVDRAEGQTAGGKRPDSVQVLCAGNVTTGWPTKLALAPVLALEIASRVQPSDHGLLFDTTPLADWPRPAVALLPWQDQNRSWWPLELPTGRQPDLVPDRRAA